MADKNLIMTVALGASVGGLVTGMKTAKDSLDGFKDRTKKLTTELEKLNKMQKQYENIQKEIAHKNELKEKLKSTHNELLKQQKILIKLKEVYENTGKSNKGLSEKIRQQEKVVKNLIKTKREQVTTFKKARDSIEHEKKGLKNYQKEIEETTKKIEKQNKIKQKMETLKNFSEKTRNNGSSLMKSSGAIFGALAIPIKIHMDVAEAQADLRKMLGDEAVKYYDELDKITKNSPLSQVEVYEVAGALAQSGIKGNEIVDYTKQAEKLKVAFDMTTEETGEFLAKTKTQLGLTKEELFSFTDTINYMSDNTASSAAQLANFSQRIGSVAKTVGLTNEANIAFGATLISMGKAPEVAATGIKQLYLELGKGADTKKKANSFAFLGLDGDKIAKEMETNAEGAIIKVLEKINKLSSSDKMQVLNNLFGEQAIDSVAALANNTEELRKNLEAVNSGQSGGAVDKEYANRMDTPLNQLKVAKNNFMLSLAKTGEALAPVLKDILDLVTPLLQKFTDWVSNNEGLVKVIGILVGSLGILLGVASGIMFVFSILTSPIGLVVVAIGIVIGIIVLLYKKCAWFRNFVNTAWKFIANLTVTIWNQIKQNVLTAFGYLKIFAQNYVNSLKADFNLILVVAKNIWNMIVSSVRTTIEVLKGIFRLFVAFFTGKWNEIPTIVSGIWESIKTGMTGFVEGAKNILKGLFDWFGEKWNVIKNGASDLWNNVKENTKNALNIGQNYTGTSNWRGGLTTVAEKGMELIKLPNGRQFLAQAQMLLNLPKGTQIYNNSKTKGMLGNGKNNNKFGSATSNLLDRVLGIQNRANNLSAKGNISMGGSDVITINISVNSNSNPVDIGRAVRKEIEEYKNNKRRTKY